MVVDLGPLPAATGPAGPDHRSGIQTLGLGPTPTHRVRRHPRRQCDDRHTPGTQLGGLRPQPQPTLKLTQMRPQHLEPTHQRLRQIRYSTTVAALSPETRLIHREPLPAWTNGTSYTFTLTATNVIGTSPASAASAAVTPTVAKAGFTGRTPVRVLDTRIGVGAPQAKLGAGNTLTLTVPGLPAGASAVALNVTITNPSAAGNLTVYPGGHPVPLASNLNYLAGQTIPNMVQVPLGPGNTVTFYNSAGTVDVIADVLGYYAPGTGGGFTGKAPARVLDTRVGLGAPQAKLGAAKTLTMTVPGLPAGASAVALNITITGATAASDLSVYPGSQPARWHPTSTTWLGRPSPTWSLSRSGPGTRSRSTTRPAP